jgi:hypothetical protein
MLVAALCLSLQELLVLQQAQQPTKQRFHPKKWANLLQKLQRQLEALYLMFPKLLERLLELPLPEQAFPMNKLAQLERLPHVLLAAQ